MRLFDNKDKRMFNLKVEELEYRIMLVIGCFLKDLLNSLCNFSKYKNVVFCK